METLSGVLCINHKSTHILQPLLPVLRRRSSVDIIPLGFWLSDVGPLRFASLISGTISSVR